MTNYMPIYLLISLVPLTFLAAAWYSTRPVHPPSGRTSGHLSAAMQRLSECIRCCCCFCTRGRLDNHTTNAPKTTTDNDLEMQRIQNQDPHPASNRPLHHSLAATTAIDAIDVQHNRAAALASLERSRSSVAVSMADLPPRPSTASSAEGLIHPGQWWKGADSDADSDDAVPAFRMETFVPGFQSAFHSLEVESQCYQGGDEWVEVSLH